MEPSLASWFQRPLLMFWFRYSLEAPNHCTRTYTYLCTLPRTHIHSVVPTLKNTSRVCTHLRHPSPFSWPPTFNSHARLLGMQPCLCFWHTDTFAHIYTHAREGRPLTHALQLSSIFFYNIRGGAMCREARSSCIRKLALFVLLTLLFVRLPLIFLNSPILSFFFILISFVLLFCLWPPPIFFHHFDLFFSPHPKFRLRKLVGGKRNQIERIYKRILK